MRGIRTFLVVVPVVLAAASGAAQELDGPPAVRAFADTTVTRVGARLGVTIEADAAPGWLVVSPEPEKIDLGAFRVRTVERVPVPEGQEYRLLVVPLEAGDRELPPVRLVAQGPDGAREEVATEPIPLRVESNLPPTAPGDPAMEPGDPSAVPAAPEPADLKPALTPERDWWPVAIAVAALLLAGALGVWLFRRWRARERDEEPLPISRKPLRPAWEIALEELDGIVAADLVARGELRLQYERVTETLRRYLENRWGVPALESTTSDLTELLRGTPLASASSARILALLREADLVKFAKGTPDPGDARSAEGRVREVVLETMPRPREEAAA